jgi:predicted O-methyltransferase YrrM
MVCHGELVRMKPHPRYLTSFYLCISAGGAVGGIFVGLVAPRMFSDYFEWHLTILATCILPFVVFVRDAGSRLHRGRSVWAWVILASITLIPIGLATHLQKVTKFRIDSARNFFGVLKVDRYPDGVAMFHGGVMHGNQFSDPKRRGLGTTYYSAGSGIGLILKQFRPDRPIKVGVVGLGAGTIAVYGREGDTFRFYEINPDVLRMAKKHFNYLSDCPAQVDVVLGDARLQLEQEPPQDFDVLVLDAFSGDAPPVHLLTSEAFDVYRRHVKPQGVIVANASNRHLDHRPVLRAQAERVGLQSLTVVQNPDNLGASHNLWVLMTHDSELLAREEMTKRRMKDNGRRILWTDSRSDLMAILL